ncbi:hypothetical protein A3C91_04030 [Candidatus Azambacteria bacterium RIFCSPHIGHO2_02_FULL_52_12]|uniref:Uncharacterized protein n=1 Tax=Candidatus Azambacteria bacterium RIFCSPLOWO2_01_FULL_46_25 TaxID=1797298 RepID=A0A1F5BUU5_9BACT|nr:MAG: hypothetical protein A3C91_04030 [Candidatus Azambacteria bacterium RIFCSPHIGHO2_02_FULL_52_12]OGD34394.1 MAG: hypothetical protein A2988_02605 [Candidatus Azambacteria bacterium RIFCSPLOWO2_01_FULL_46_25]OGD37328.1 MAG: hypothetical protein A2850_01285 [Candidatus Azambacteria bacterium RIFCSPHIGHO2_01_FULL_51_74]
MENTAGKITIFSLSLGLVFFLIGVGIDFGTGGFEKANANTATTAVTVLNTPPSWSVDAQEAAESSTASPTNIGATVSWTGTATDPNGESFYLLVCRTSGAPTANASAAPICNGGAPNHLGVSSLTASAAQATATYTALAADPESNDWYAWICDGNAGVPRCNATYKQGTGNTASPFVVNHRPTLTVFADNSPQPPSGTVTWTTTASDPDTLGGADTVQLFVCKANDFTGSACGAGGTYCSTALGASNPTCDFVLENPKQDKNYAAYGFVRDNHALAATGGQQGADSVVTVSNVAPTIAAATVSLLDTDEAGPLTLTAPQGETSGFKVKFTVTDANSCQNATSGDEISTAITDVYRSGVTSASCQIAGNYNANSCYPAATGLAMWNLNCSQDVGSCSGASDADATWTCTFPLWYIADPTDGANLTDSTWFAENWLASVRATDDNSAASALVEGTSGNEVQSFLAYSTSAAAINYGSLEPGETNDPIDRTLGVIATGNVGLDETLYGLGMCTTFPACSGAPSDTIPVGSQKYDATGVAYASATALLASPGVRFDRNIPKTTSTSTPASLDTFWGINIPSAITLAGDYTGQNTIIGVKGEAQQW